ncbi:hypothetical protein KEJ47_07430 [Candidatus Bathyarchaeota archaeon]|nr:hypothetical protein [Candidatus Bathyarchaeota archaeon]
MESTIEYITAGIIISLILGLTIHFSSNMVDVKVNAIEQKTGFEIAGNVIDTLLLSPGKPNNWGGSPELPSSMGLALDNAVKLYQLDPLKVRRLSNESSGYIPPYLVRDLLGLSACYYTSIRIMPIYTITISNITEEIFSISVTNQWGTPVPNANITAAYTNLEEMSMNEVISFLKGDLEDAIYAYNRTSSSGECVLNFSGAGSRDMLIVLADQLNIKSFATWPVQSDAVITNIQSSMGTPSSFPVEVASRNVEIDSFNYVVILTIWWS